MARVWLLVLASLLGVDGHGFLTFPVSRRLAEKRSTYTSITAFAAGNHITNCGTDGLSTPSTVDVVSNLTRGTVEKFDIQIDAHHAGHLEMRLCPFVLDGDDADISSCSLLQRATAAEAGVSDCQEVDDRDICAAIDPQNPAWWYLAPESRGTAHSMWFHIPSDACASDRCTVQFTWKTANSCNPHPASYCNYYQDLHGPQHYWCKNWYCGGFCAEGSGQPDNCQATMGDRKCCSETFTNCAEVRLVGESGPPSPTPPPSARPTSAPSAAPTAPPTSGNASSDGCVHQIDCDVSAWCKDPTYDQWCQAFTAADCPTPQCKVSGDDDDDDDDPTTTGVPSPPTPAPTDSGSTNPCEDGSTSSCKHQCSEACKNAVSRNQCWGDPRYIECKCSDGTTHTFPGCACERSMCGGPASLVDAAFRKHKKGIRKHTFLAGDHIMLQGGVKQAAAGESGNWVRSEL